MPKCFGSTEHDAHSFRDAARTPSQLGDSGAKKHSKKKSTLPGSLFDTDITKTVDTLVESRKPAADDELQLVKLNPSGKSVAESTEDVPRAAESLYREQHLRTIPRDW